MYVRDPVKGLCQNPNCCAPKVSAPNAWVPQLLCSKSQCPKYLGAPMAVLQKASAPNAWVPLWLCPILQCPYGCAPNAVRLVPASRYGTPELESPFALK